MFGSLALTIACLNVVGQAALVLKQQEISINRDQGKTVMLSCSIEGAARDTLVVHWYRTRAGALSHLLYCSTLPKSAVLEPGLSQEKFTTEYKEGTFFLVLSQLLEEDSGYYYCASWGETPGVKYFGTGTQLMITSRPTKKPSAKILPPSPAEVENNGEGTFLCILNGFFPYIIKVEWAEKGETSSSQLKMETGEIASNDFLVSWLTVSKADLWNKQFECQYWHESNSQSKGYKEKEITNPGIGKAGGPAEGERCPSDIVNSTNIAKSMVLNFSNNVAYITYILLLLKSTCYSSIIVFFIYKMKTASTSHDKA